jgi:Protein of unknown function (DUF2877)
MAGAAGAGGVGAGAAPLGAAAGAAEAGTAAPRSVRAGWAGPGAARALAAGGGGRVAVSLCDGAYLQLDGGWLLLAPPRAPRGPLTLLVDELPALAAGEPVAIGAEMLETRGLRVDLGALRPVEQAPPPARPAAGAGEALRAALACRPRPGAELEPGIAELAGGRRAAAVVLLAGRGPGLTPAGDDVLAGYAAWCHADGAPAALARAAAPRTTPLSLAYLRCAERGELPDVAARVLAAVRAGDAAAAARAARSLDQWGATSGSALLWGMAAAFAAGGRAP